MSGMSIWILAFIVVVATTLAGWRQGAIRAAFSTVGILVAALLASLVGSLVQPLLKYVGMSNPIYAWALAPVIGFILISILFAVLAQPVHKKIEHFYKYEAGDLRLALWERLNSRVGICLGVMNGAMYFVLISFLVFNVSYLTSQISAEGKQQPTMVQLANQLGKDLESVGFSRTATAVATLPPLYYQLSDLSGFLMQNPQAGQRFAQYPGLTSLWQRDDMQGFVMDGTLTNALVSQVSLGDVFSDTVVQGFLANPDQTKMVVGILTTNLADLTNYLQTGKSEKYSQKIIGHWDFNPAVTFAWMRQGRKMSGNEMRALRAYLLQAYAQTHVLVTGDNQVFVKSLPRVKNTGPGQPPAVENNDWKGDWSANGNNFDIHLVFSGEDKFMTASAEELRLTIKDGKNIMIFDRAD
jgi:hypothetical protein